MNVSRKYDKNWIKYLRTFIILSIWLTLRVGKPIGKTERYDNISLFNRIDFSDCKYHIRNLNEQDTVVVLFDKPKHGSMYSIYVCMILSTNLNDIDSSAFLFNNRKDLSNFFAKGNIKVYDTVIINSRDQLNNLRLHRNGEIILNEYNTIRGPSTTHKTSCRIKPAPDISSYSINQLNNGWRYQAIIQYRRDRVLGKPALFPFWAYWVEILCVLAFFIVWPPKLLWSNMRKALK